jgi:flagellar hook-basal body complex protein FliE
MSDTPSFTDTFSKFVPGFEFLQGLVKNAGQTLPSIGQWVAPTLDPEELDRRINELRTVQFWLDQNARMIGTTVQALEVQRMTLGTLKTMNVQMGDLGEALKVRSMADMFQSAPAAAPAAASAPAPAPAPTPESAAADAGASGAVDPMQWWGALTQQFTQLATQAMQATSEATTEAQARAAEALKATTAAATEAQARASEAMAEAVKGAVSTAAETVAAAKPASKAPTRKASPKPSAAPPAPAPAAAPKKAPAKKAPARKATKG